MSNQQSAAERLKIRRAGYPYGELLAETPREKIWTAGALFFITATEASQPC